MASIWRRRLFMGLFHLHKLHNNNCIILYYAFSIACNENSLWCVWHSYSYLEKIVFANISFCVSLEQHAQFLINNIEPSYDKKTGCFLFSISEEQFGEDFRASVGLNDGSEWQALTIDGCPAGENFTFENVKGDKSYLIETVINNQAKCLFSLWENIVFA